MPRVALVTCRDLPEPDPDQELLSDALSAAGVEPQLAAWDDPDTDWGTFDLAVIRSTWNYHRQVDAFAGWVEATAAVTRLENAVDLVLPNLHKGYLLDLVEQGIPVVPTLLASGTRDGTLRELVEQRGWQTVVVKPAVSAGSWMTHRCSVQELDSLEASQLHEIRGRDLLVQPFVEAVTGYGERSLVWIDGELTHAIRKSPRFSDDAESVSREAVPVSDAERDLARRVLDVAAPGATPLYARVDLAPDADGDPMLMELELVEPSLFLEQHPPALAQFVEAITARL